MSSDAIKNYLDGKLQWLKDYFEEGEDSLTANKNFVVYDLETTGLNVVTDEPTQISYAIYNRDFQLLESNSFYVKKLDIEFEDIHPSALEITKLKREDRENGLEPREAITRLLKACQGCYVTSYNGHGFDDNMVTAMVLKLWRDNPSGEFPEDFSFHSDFDVFLWANYILADVYWMENFKLSSVSEVLNIPVPDDGAYHDAEFDVAQTGAVLNQLLLNSVFHDPKSKISPLDLDDHDMVTLHKLGIRRANRKIAKSTFMGFYPSKYNIDYDEYNKNPLVVFEYLIGEYADPQDERSKKYLDTIKENLLEYIEILKTNDEDRIKRQDKKMDHLFSNPPTEKDNFGRDRWLNESAEIVKKRKQLVSAAQYFQGLSNINDNVHFIKDNVDLTKLKEILFEAFSQVFTPKETLNNISHLVKHAMGNPNFGKYISQLKNITQIELKKINSLFETQKDLIILKQDIKAEIENPSLREARLLKRKQRAEEVEQARQQTSLKKKVHFKH